MNVEQLTIETLLNHAGVSAIVGTKVYPLVARQTISAPYIAIFKVSDVREYSHCGYSGLKRVRMQINCYTKDGDPSAYETVKNLAEQVKDAMENMVGGAKAVFQDSDVEDYDTETRFFKVILDFIIEFKE